MAYLSIIHWKSLLTYATRSRLLALLLPSLLGYGLPFAIKRSLLQPVAIIKESTVIWGTERSAAIPQKHFMCEAFEGLGISTELIVCRQQRGQDDADAVLVVDSAACNGGTLL